MKKVHKISLLSLLGVVICALLGAFTSSETISIIAPIMGVVFCGIICYNADRELTNHNIN